MAANRKKIKYPYTKPGERPADEILGTPNRLLTEGEIAAILLFKDHVWISVGRGVNLSTLASLTEIGLLVQDADDEERYYLMPAGKAMFFELYQAPESPNPDPIPEPPIEEGDTQPLPPYPPAPKRVAFIPGKWDGNSAIILDPCPPSVPPKAVPLVLDIVEMRLKGLYFYIDYILDLIRDLPREEIQDSWINEHSAAYSEIWTIEHAGLIRQ